VFAFQWWGFWDGVGQKWRIPHLNPIYTYMYI
jgi:hypothetical protein